MQTETSPIVSFKGFDKDLKCRDYQYAIGESFENAAGASACHFGFHACEYPLNVFDYYAPAGNRFCLVEQSGTLSRHDSDTKIASSKITIKAEIGIAGLVKAAIEYTTARCKPIDKDSPQRATGDQGAASATGTRGAASATGDQGAASATGDQGAASATGTRGAASATGYQGAAMASGYEGRARGGDGCALFLVRRNDDYEITHVHAAIVGRDGIKADVFYTLDGSGRPVEVSE